MRAETVEMERDEGYLKEFLKLIVCQAGIFDNGLEGVRIEPLVVRNRYAVSSVRHADVFAAGYDLESDLTECLDCPISRDISKNHFRQEPLPDIPLNLLFPLLSSGDTY